MRQAVELIPVTRSIEIANQHPRLRLVRHGVARVIATLDAHATLFRGGCPAGELSIAFMSDAALAKLHGDFLDDPSITDVITFEGRQEFGTAGEICVSADAALRQTTLNPGRDARATAPKPKLPTRRSHRAKLADAEPRTTSAGDDFSTELTLYVVHGWLHLAGYDDLVPAKKRVMRRAEARAMQLLRNSPEGVPTFSLARRS